MPQPPKRPCNQPGCPELVLTGYCEAHSRKPKTYDRERGNSDSRGYDVKWRRFRAWFLRQPDNAICRDCERKPSAEVHHVKKVRDFPELRLKSNNCMGLCKPCHSARTARGE